MNYEDHTSHNITVHASDAAATLFPYTTLFRSSDVAPSAPVDGNAGANTVAEGAADGSLVGLTATSSDPNGPPVTFSLTDDARSEERRVGKECRVRVAEGTLLNYEDHTSHNITVYVLHAAGGIRSHCVTGVLTCALPIAPVDGNAGANTVAEGAADGSLVGLTATSSDPNGPPVTFSLTDDA